MRKVKNIYNENLRKMIKDDEAEIAFLKSPAGTAKFESQLADERAKVLSLKDKYEAEKLKSVESKEPSWREELAFDEWQAELRVLRELESKGKEGNIAVLRARIESNQSALKHEPDFINEGAPVTSADLLKDMGVIDGGNNTPVTLYKITKFPTQKGPRNFDTPAILHPDFEADVKRLANLGYEVSLDPGLGISKLQGMQTDRFVHIRPDSPYHVFKHEAQHAEFNHFIAGRMPDIEKAVANGQSIKSVFSETEIRSIGKDKIEKLENLLKKQNTHEAVDETLAVDAQLGLMGWQRASTPTYIQNKMYAVWHQIRGYQDILQSGGSLNPMQLAEYNKTLREFGLMTTYVEGAEASQKFVNGLSAPSKQSLLAISTKLQQMQNQKLNETSILYDEQGNLVYQRQDGTWEKLKLKPLPR